MSIAHAAAQTNWPTYSSFARTVTEPRQELSGHTVGGDGSFSFVCWLAPQATEEDLKHLVEIELRSYARHMDRQANAPTVENIPPVDECELDIRRVRCPVGGMQYEVTVRGEIRRGTEE